MEAFGDAFDGAPDGFVVHGGCDGEGRDVVFVFEAGVFDGPFDVGLDFAAEGFFDGEGVEEAVADFDAEVEEGGEGFCGWKEESVLDKRRALRGIVDSSTSKI